MRLRTIGVAMLGLLLAGVSTAWAQVSTTGTIQVIVEDPQGGRLPGVTVSASATDVVTSRQAVSDAEGVATLEALAPSARYTVKAQLSGFRDLERTDILVRTGQVTTLRAELALSTVTESVTVQGQTTPLVDVTRATSGQDITLQLTESLPTGRTYQSYLQLVPGVLPDSQVATGNPSSRSGMNWKDSGTTSDNIGSSTDNSYYFEGINVTDPVTGTFGANLNTEIIQEQKVITGGIPAEYVGAPGLISTVITKSGSNDYHGSGNFFYRNQDFFAANEHNPGAAFSNKDTAFTVGGPILKNALWAFGSYRYLGRQDSLNAQDTNLPMRDVQSTNHQGFAKGTWAPSQNDTLSFMFLNDPFTRNCQTDNSVMNGRCAERKQGGNNYSGTYNRVFSKLLVEGGANYHDTQISDLAIGRSSRNTVSFLTSAVRTLNDEQLGGFGSDAPETRPTMQARGAVQYQWREHRLKGGIEWAQHEDHRDLVYTGDRAQYTSLSSQYLNQGVTAGQVSAGPWSSKQFRNTTASDFNGLIATINRAPNRQSYYDLFDTDKNGTITSTELGNSLLYNSTAGNPNGQLNYYRIWMSQLGPQDTETRGWSYFAQDDFSINRFTFNVGLRAEKWMHYGTTGDKIFSFDTTWAPRLSASYDIMGDGKQKITAYYGRYYDPVRMDMTNFAGSPTGTVREEQVYVAQGINQWVTYRTRGPGDGQFTPSTKTPYTNEFQLQHEIDLGHNMSFGTTWWQRWTRDIMEDYDLSVYAEPPSNGGYDDGYGSGNINAPDTLWLGYPYFGLDPSNPPVSNFFLGTLPGAERNYKGLEFVFRKRFADRWQMLSSYNWLDSDGNAVSDGNADFAGDVLWLDPRAVNMTGPIPGTIHHIFKTGGSYTTPWGIELGANYSYNSGTIVNKTQLLSSRRLPIQGSQVGIAPYLANGVVDDWVAPGVVGLVQNPGWGELNLRVQYVKTISRYTTELFLDLFNVINDQAATRTEDLVAGTGTTHFGDEIQWRLPRNAFIGARVRF